MSNFLSKYSVLLLLLIIPTLSQSYTIEEILKQVKDKSDDIEISEIEYKVSGEEVKMSRSEAFPQINLSTGVGYAGQSLASNRYSSSAASTTTFNPMNELNHLHGTTMNWSVTLNQPLITFGKVKSALKIADIYKGQREDSRSIKKEGYYATVIQGFIAAYTAQEDVKIAEQTVQYDERYLEKVRVDFELGTALPRDTLNVFAKLSASRSSLIHAKVQLKTALRKLAKLTELDINESTPLSYDSNGWLSQVSNKSATEKSLELLLKESEVSMRKEQITYERSKLFPSVYLNAGINNSFMIPNIKQAEKDLDKILEDKGMSTSSVNLDGLEEIIPGPEDYFNPDFINYSIGLQLTWNIYDGNRTKANFHKTRFLYEKSKVELKKLEDEKSITVSEAQDLYKAIEESKVAATAQRDALQRAFESITDDYNDGYAEFLTFSDMERNIATTNKNINALDMQKILAVTQYRIASGISIVKEVK